MRPFKAVHSIALPQHNNLLLGATAGVMVLVQAWEREPEPGNGAEDSK